MKMHPYFKPAKATVASTWSVPDLCAAYDWPVSQPGGGIIAIVELGGGWLQSDMDKYFASIDQPVPSIIDVSVDGTTNSPGDDADIEVALDIQVAAAAYFVATGTPAIIRVYWSADIASAVSKAHADGCDVCSISWGADEVIWGKQAAAVMGTVAWQAVLSGMAIFAAAGDNDSSDGGSSPSNVDLPAAQTAVIGCGGTTKTLMAETVWNNNPGNADGSGTGGGYSTYWPHPQWQLDAPAAISGRMVPDVAGNADPNTGYQIIARGQSIVVGGTSAVAPLYSGLIASCGKKLGWFTYNLYRHPECFNDITVGDNGVWAAMVGPDPCTGMGTPIGNKIAALLTKVVN